MDRVWVAAVTHKYGVNFYASKTEAGLLHQLADYCREWWGSEPFPETDQEVITAYFEDHDPEYYDLGEIPVGD